LQTFEDQIVDCYFIYVLIYLQLFSLVGDNWIYDTPLAKRLATNGEPQ
jgi:hypothetical protein